MAQTAKDPPARQVLEKRRFGLARTAARGKEGLLSLGHSRVDVQTSKLLHAYRLPRAPRYRIVGPYAHLEDPTCTAGSYTTLYRYR